MEEEEDVYEEMDEETYAAHVESRRNQEDFVVDDNGNGYADNGEEWIGATEDERERKKRKMREAGVDGDKKLAKNARKLAEAGAKQQGQMRNFARAGVSEANKKTAAAAMIQADDIDIDDLLGTIPRGKSASGNQRRQQVIPKPKQRLPQRKDSMETILGLALLVPASMSGEPDQVTTTSLQSIRRLMLIWILVVTIGAQEAAPSFQSKSISSGTARCP